MRKTMYIAVLAAILVLVAGCGQKEEINNKSSQTGDEAFKATLDASRDYLFLHWRTEKVLTEASNYPDYESWKKDMEELKNQWLGMKGRAAQLRDISEHYLGDSKQTSWQSIPTAHAITYGEITDIFDKAPAKKKIQTLAEHLGVDAQQAYDLLDQAQNHARAEAWHEAGDTFQKLETSAVVIKDGCKVSGFVGGVVLSGGTAGLAGASVATKAAVVVSGADLALEVSEDGANIALGNHNQVSEFFGDARKFTEPAATILTIGSLPENMASNFDKFSAVMIAADQFRSSAQEGKIIGISLPTAQANSDDHIESAVMDQEELDDWLSNLWHKQEDKSLEELMKEVAQDLEKEEQFQETVAKGSGEEDKEEANLEENEESEEEVESNTEEEEEEDAPPQDNPSASGADGAVQAVFNSPNEKTFQIGQSRNWSVEVSGLDQVGKNKEENKGDESELYDIIDSLDTGAISQCHFTFYLNGTKFREMKNNRACGFTHTLIDKPGSLHVQAEVEISKNNEIIDTITLTRNYKVVVPEVK